jgi:hypothetical protein
MEEWRDIPNYEGYQVSNKGRVRTHNKTSYTEKHGVRHWKDRILKFKSKSNNTGYRVDLWKDGKPRTMLVARLIAFTFYNKDINDNTLTVNHLDRNRFNNNLENLELISLKENIQHAFRTGVKNQKNVKITDKITGITIFSSSLAGGSLIIKQNKGYLSYQIKQKKFENERYEWELV